MVNGPPLKCNTIFKTEPRLALAPRAQSEIIRERSKMRVNDSTCSPPSQPQHRRTSITLVATVTTTTTTTTTLHIFLFSDVLATSYSHITINILKFPSLLKSSDYETLQIEQTNTEADNDLPIMSLTLRLYLDCNPSQAKPLLNKNQYSLYNDYWHSDLPGDRGRGNNCYPNPYEDCTGS